MMSLKNLIQLKPREERSEVKDKPIPEEQRKQTYCEAGEQDSERNSGNPKALSVCFDTIFSRFEKEEKELAQKQHELKKPYLDEQKLRESEIKGYHVAIDNATEVIQHEEERIKEIESTIRDLKFEIQDIPKQPHIYVDQVKKGASVKFWIGLVMLLPLTVYLFSFYASVVYSAMEKQFTYDDQRWFVPDAIVLAFEDGAQAAVTVIFAPFIFIGLGYLIHMFHQQKTILSSVKLFGVVAITFLFDVLLAFFVEKKLWELNVSDEDAQFGFSEAMQSQEFWLIIFLGFVAYLIWGFIFDFVMEEHKEIDKIKNAVQSRHSQIRIHKEHIGDYKIKIDEQKDLIRELKVKISKAKGRIEELQRIIDGTIIPTKEYKLYASEYMKGWMTYIIEHIAVAREVQKDMVENCHAIYEKHLKTVGVTEESINTVFTKTL